MGAGQSGGVEIGGSPMGYQVLRVYPDSPGSKAGLKAYFDFIVAIGNTRFCKEDGSLREILKASVDQKIKMFVYNTRNKMVREVEIVPTTSWGGSGLLGVSIKHSSFDKADERVWHVTEVDPNSPAQQAGFKAMNDYVIGSDSILQENDDLYNLIEAHEGKALKLFVYNVETDNCREIICRPNSKWGGRGLLGCEFGHGLLHRIPFADTPAGGDTKTCVPSAQQSAMGTGNQQSLNGSAAPPMQANLLQHQASLLNRTATQPGQQLFQQALFNNQCSTPQQQQQQQQQQQPQQDPIKPVDQAPPPQAPQTFAQLASAQFQAQQYQQQTEQIQQQQQLLEQQRLQLEEQKRQMEQLAARQSPPTAAAAAAPVPAPAAAPLPSTIPAYPKEQASPQQNYQQGPPLPPPPQQPQQAQPLQQYPPPSQHSTPPPQAPPTQPPVGQQSPFQHQQQPPLPPFMAQNQMPAQSSPYQQQQQQQQQYPYGGMPATTQQQQQASCSVFPGANESGQSSLPPSFQTLPPPPTMYPPPPQAPPSQQQQQPQSQPPPPMPQQQQQQQQPPPVMFANQM